MLCCSVQPVMLKILCKIKDLLFWSFALSQTSQLDRPEPTNFGEINSNLYDFHENDFSL